MLPDTPDVRLVVLEPGGLVDLLTEGQVYVDMSTISPACSQEIASALTARGIGALDAPVSGGEQAAIDGNLSVMAGGEAETLESVRPLLMAMAGSVTHVGPAGSGQLTKAANQLIVAANIQAIAEAVVLLERTGVDLEPALAAISGGLAGSAVLTRKMGSFLDADYRPGFRVDLHCKDLRIVAGTSQSHGLCLPQTALVSQLMTSVQARGGGDLDHSALLKGARELNGDGAQGGGDLDD